MYKTWKNMFSLLNAGRIERLPKFGQRTTLITQEINRRKKYSSNANMKKLWGNTCRLPLTIRSIVKFPKKLGFEQKNARQSQFFEEKTKGKGFLMLENIWENTEKIIFSLVNLIFNCILTRREFGFVLGKYFF